MADATFESLGLWGLFASAFLSATLLPGNSEIVFVALLDHAPALEGPALLVGTIGNTLGGLTSYLVGRLFPKPEGSRAVAWIGHDGSRDVLALDR